MLAVNSYTEYYESRGFAKGEIEDKRKGKAEGIAEGLTKGKIEALQAQIETFKDLLAKDQMPIKAYKTVAIPMQDQIESLKQKLRDLENA